MIIRVNQILKHPNADRLGVIFVKHPAFEIPVPVVVRLDLVRKGQLVEYVAPGEVVDTRDERFAFLGPGDFARVGVREIRGMHSYGFVVKPRSVWLELFVVTCAVLFGWFAPWQITLAVSLQLLFLFFWLSRYPRKA